MATVFKTFLNNDVATTRTLLNEAIPIDGKLMFGSYFEPTDPPNGNDSNIKTFPHEMFQSVYDYPFLKSSSNHIFDITLGYSSDTLLDTDEVTYPDAAQAKKRALYNQFAQIMVGHDKDGNILKFDEDGNILEGGDKYDEAYLLSVARLLNKDEMKKGSFYLQLDFAVTEPGQRLYTDPGSPPTWPVAENPTLSFKDFAAKTSCPAGFFEYNAGSVQQVDIVTTGGFPLGGTSATATYKDVVLINVGPEYVFVSDAPASAAPASGKVEVHDGTLQGGPSLDLAMENLVKAILDSDGLGDGGSNASYAYAAGEGANQEVTAVWDTSTDTLSLVSLDNILFQGRVGSDSTSTWTGTVTDASSPPSAFTPGGGSVLFTSDASADTLINSDDYRRISMIITDEGAQNDYRVNSPAGDYGILKIKEYKIEKWDAATNTISDVCVIDAEALEAAGVGAPTPAPGICPSYDRKVGLVYYQAGVVAITPYVFNQYDCEAADNWVTLTPSEAATTRGKYLTPGFWDDDPVDTVANTWSTCTGDTIVADLETFGEYPGDPAVQAPALTYDGAAGVGVQQSWQNYPIDSSTGGDSNATGFRRRMVRMAFNNTTELNSSIYFCRLNNNEFNYSANPTYLNESKIRVKETTLDAPVSYVTTVGLYSADNELLAQAKLSEPVRKDPTNEFVLRVRLDY